MLSSIALLDWTLRWRSSATGKAFGLAISRSRVQILLEVTLRNNLGQVVYTLCASVTKQYNLVPAKKAVMLCGWGGNRRPGGK